MSNGELVQIANITNDTKLKAKLRDRFNNWCKANNKSKFEQNALALWMTEDALEET